jgi:hypothetical protein
MYGRGIVSREGAQCTSYSSSLISVLWARVGAHLCFHLSGSLHDHDWLTKVQRYQYLVSVVPDVTRGLWR